VGDAAFINTHKEFSIKNIALFKPNPSVVDNKYLYYVVIGPKFKEELFSKRAGVAQPFFSLEMLRSHEVEYHKELLTQHRIASILSTYDDLIENNTRRIQILEEMAQRIYREWFVDFKFPGHENVKMVESELGMIPEGWEVRSMSELSDVVDCLHSKKPASKEDGVGLLLQLFNIGQNGKIDLSKKYMISASDYEKWSARIEASEGDCVITNVGRIAAVAQISVGIKAALGRNMTAVRPKRNLLGPTYLIEYLLSPHMANEVKKKKDAGTIMDSLNVHAIYKLSVPIPNENLMRSFEQIARPIRRRIELAMEQNANLRTTRDLLLPKLISGKIDVSDLDIDIGELNNDDT